MHVVWPRTCCFVYVFRFQILYNISCRSRSNLRVRNRPSYGWGGVFKGNDHTATHYPQNRYSGSVSGFTYYIVHNCINYIGVEINILSIIAKNVTNYQNTGILISILFSSVEFLI